eukprot:gb/GFBE01067379.1/.p1 GENE.gb/GFBE01067379.1/~~gb/GFBE01067379.1/.p1  ORF type:complete len:345 (+),score=57.26 gb/GFBE01067379.1/:1-1035(+)
MGCIFDGGAAHVKERFNGFRRFYGLTLSPVKYRAHRLGGIFLLSTYPIAWFLYIYDFDSFLSWRAPLWPALAGLFQSVSATLTFTFLPKMVNSGAMSRNRGSLSHNFVKENIFYQLVTVFWVVHYLFKAELERSLIGNMTVIVFTFLPFSLVRPLFPITPFKYDPKDEFMKRRSSAEDVYKLPEWLTMFMRYTYLIFKHVVYFGFNYRCFLGGPDEVEARRDSWPLVLAFVGGLNWLFFQHTLLLKNIVKPWTAEGPVIGIICLTLIYLPRTMGILLEEPRVLLLSMFGLLINVLPYYVKVPRWTMHVHYALAMLVLATIRYKHPHPLSLIRASLGNVTSMAIV